MKAPDERRVLVTGASGFIGRHALAPLAARGFAVHAVAREASRIPSVPAGPGVPEIRRHEADLLDSTATETLVREVRPDCILHLAGYVEHGKFWDAPANIDWLAATLRLLRALAAAGGRRFVGAGTCAEYDWTSATAPLGEATPLRPATLYGAAKASAFLTGAAFAREAGVSFAWGRVFHLFGPGEAPARLVPALIRAHLRGERMDCGSGEAVRDFLPVESVADAFAALCAGDVAGAVNIGSGEGVALRDLSERIAAVAGSRGEIRFGTRPDSGPASLVPDVSRLSAEAGWRNPVDFETALRRAVGWWKTRP